MVLNSTKMVKKVRIRYTLFDPIYQTEASYNSDNYSLIYDFLGMDSIVFTNLEVRAE